MNLANNLLSKRHSPYWVQNQQSGKKISNQFWTGDVYLWYDISKRFDPNNQLAMHEFDQTSTQHWPDTKAPMHQNEFAKSFYQPLTVPVHMNQHVSFDVQVNETELAKSSFSSVVPELQTVEKW